MADTLKGDLWRGDILKLIDTYKGKENNDHYICRCPKCEQSDDRGKLKLYISKTKLLGYCFICHTRFVDNSKEKYSLIKDFSIKFESDAITEASNITYKASSPLQSKGLDYLNSRNSFIQDWSKYGIKQLDDDRIIIPIKYIDKDLSFQVRLISEHNYTLSNVKKPLYIPNYKEGVKKIIICEGVFDVIAMDYKFPDYNVIGVLGSTMSKYQIKLFDNLGYYEFDEIIVALDDINLSRELIVKAKLYNYTNNLLYLESSGNDPEEILMSNGEFKFIEYKHGRC